MDSAFLHEDGVVGVSNAALKSCSTTATATSVERSRISHRTAMIFT
ncbi:MAG: hypothetical protein RXO30_08525 [Thermoproteus sp.]